MPIALTNYRLDNLLNAYRKLLPLAALCPLMAAAQLLDPPIADESLSDEALLEEEQPPRFSVEIIVFQYAPGAAGGNEIFEPEIPAEVDPALSDAIAIESTGNVDASAPVFSDKPLDGESLSPEELDPFFFENFELRELPSRAGLGYEMLPPEQFSMTEIHEELVRLDAYQPLLWSGWIQQAVDEESTLPIKLRSLGEVPINVDGALTLYLKNYLHLVVDLSLQQRIASIEPVYPQQKSGEPVNSPTAASYVHSDFQTIIYEIVEDRIFRSGQLRYFDHPRFGVLARVLRIEDMEAESIQENGLLLPADQPGT